MHVACDGRSLFTARGVAYMKIDALFGHNRPNATASFDARCECLWHIADITLIGQTCLFDSQDEKITDLCHSKTIEIELVDKHRGGKRDEVRRGPGFALPAS